MMRRWNAIFSTGMPKIMLMALAVMVIPRVVANDLQLLPAESPLYLVLVNGPYLVYLAVALFRKNERPFYDFIVLGALIGLIIGVTHLIILNHGEGIFNILLILLRAFIIGFRIGLILALIATVVSWIRNRRMRNVKKNSPPVSTLPEISKEIMQYAPVLCLLLLAPWIGEFLLGSSPFQNLIGLPLIIPLYGGGALLIREITRRTGRGWPTIFLLAVSYGVIEACLIDQSLFNPYFFEHANRKAAPIPLLGISAYDALTYVAGHAIWSISVPIAITEMLMPARNKAPWLGKLGLAMTVVLYLVGCVIVFSFIFSENKFMASPMQLISSAVVALLLIVIAFSVKTNILRSPHISVKVLEPWPLGISSFVAASLFFAKPENWLGVIAGVAILGLTSLLVSYWSSRREWSIQHEFALTAGALLTYAWGGFTVTLTLWPDNLLAWFGNVLFAMLAVVLLVVTAKQLRRYKI